MNSGHLDELAAMNCGVLQLDADRRIDAVNPALAEWRGLPENKLVGSDLDVLLTRSCVLYWETTVEPLLEQQGHAWDQAMEVQTESGEPEAVLVNVQREGGFTQCLMFHYSERRRYERMIQAVKEQTRRQEEEIERLEQTEAFRRDFINGAAHELATPMTPLRLQLHLLERILSDHADPKARRALRVMRANLDRLSRLIASLLASAEVEAGRIGMRVDRISLHETVPQIVEAWQRRHAPDREIQVEVRDGVIHADVEALGSSLGHLLDHVVMSSAPGSPVLVKVRSGSRVRIEVASPTQDAPAHKIRGTGLGLQIVDGLMKAQAGRLIVERGDRGEGIQAILDFPVAPVEQEGEEQEVSSGRTVVSG